jgi:hypothetical protein
MYRSGGQISGTPTVTLQTASWPNVLGRMFVAELAEPSVRFRLDTGGPIQGRTVALAPSSLFVASTDGYVYSIDELTGTFNWDFSSGEAIRQAPVAVGERLFAITDRHNLYCLSAQDGSQQWSVSQINDVLAIGQTRIYVSDRLGQIAVLDLQTGGRLATLPASGLDLRIVNSQTDRLYLGTADGLLVCVREVGSEWPLLHLPLPQPAPEGKEPPKKAPTAPARPGPEKPAASTASPVAEQDVFGEQPAADQADEDPFGAGSSDAEPAAPPSKDKPLDSGNAGSGSTEPKEDSGADDPFDFQN